MTRRRGAPANFPRPLADADGNIIPLRRKLRVRLEAGRMVDRCWVVTTGRERNLAAYVTVLRIDGVSVAAHRHMWAHVHGRDIDPGYVVHHLCFHKHCVNPAHLQLTTFGENSRQNNFPMRYVAPLKEAA